MRQTAGKSGSAMSAAAGYYYPRPRVLPAFPRVKFVARLAAFGIDTFRQRQEGLLQFGP